VRQADIFRALQFRISTSSTTRKSDVMTDVGTCRTRRRVSAVLGRTNASTKMCVESESDRIIARSTFVGVMLGGTRVPTHSAEYSLANRRSLFIAQRASFFRVDCVGSARLAYARLQRRRGDGRQILGPPVEWVTVRR
jgi:hypothetical protein